MRPEITFSMKKIMWPFLQRGLLFASVRLYHERNAAGPTVCDRQRRRGRDHHAGCQRYAACGVCFASQTRARMQVVTGCPRASVSLGGALIANVSTHWRKTQPVSFQF